MGALRITALEVCVLKRVVSLGLVAAIRFTLRKVIHRAETEAFAQTGSRVKYRVNISAYAFS